MSIPAANRAELHDEASIEINSEAVEYVRPGLGRWLARGAAAALLGELGLVVIAITLKSLGLGWLAFWSGWLRDIGSVAFRAAPALAVLSVLVTSVSLPRPGPARVSVTREGVHVRRGGRSRFIPKEKIADGLVVPTQPKHSAVLHLRGGDQLSFVVNTEGEALNTFDKLGIGPDQRRTVATLRGPGRQLVAGCVGLGVSSIALLIALMALSQVARAFAVMFPLAMTALIGITWAIFRSFRPPEVAIGSDGVLIRRAWTSRFIPYSMIEGVRARAGDGTWASSSHLDLTLLRGGRGGERSEVVSVGSGDGRLVEGLADRVRDVMAKNAGDAELRAAESLARAELLDPSGRSVSAWREALSSLVGEEAGYRRRSLSKDDLLAVLRDPEAPAGRRIGAAIALRASRHPDAHERIRVAAEACASDPLREALESAAKDELDEATLEQALAEAALQSERKA